MSEQKFTKEQLEAIKSYEESLKLNMDFLKSKLPREHAIQHINHYRHGMGHGAMKSVWLNKEIIKFIIQYGTSHNISGIRVYMGKYKKDVPPLDEHPDWENKHTVILAPTLSITTTGTTGIIETREQDFPDSYFNYGRPCPPTCNEGDIGEN